MLLNGAKRLLDGLKASQGERAYRKQVKGTAQSLWNGKINLLDFVTAMEQNLEVGYGAAFAEGARTCHVEPEDFTEDEREVLADKVDEHSALLADFGRWIVENDKEAGVKFGDIEPRVSLWWLRYGEVRELGRVLACANEPLEWVYDPAKENCRSCARLNGQVRRAFFWQESGILPRVAGAEYLECRGFLCGCELVPTNRPVSRGRLPGLP